MHFATSIIKLYKPGLVMFATSGALSFIGGEADEVRALCLHPGDELTVRVTTCCSQAWRFWVIALWIIVV